MQLRDIITGLMVIVVWGLNFVVIKLGLADIPPLMLGTLRFLAACVPAIFFIPRPPVAWRWLIAVGLSINVGQFALLFLGMKLGMPAGLASLVLQAQAFFTFAIAVKFLGEQWRWNQITGLVLATGGMVIIGSQQDGNITAVGFWLTLAAAVCWSIGNITIRRVSQTSPPFAMLALVVWASAVAVLPLALLSWWIEGSAAWYAVWQSPTLSAFGSVIYLAYCATLGGYALWGGLLSRYPAALVSPFALLVPVVGMSSSAFLLGEALTFWQTTGTFLVMMGLAVHVLGVQCDSALRAGRRQGK